MFGQSIRYARELLKHPQMCLRADRTSMYDGQMSGDEWRKAMQAEFVAGLHALDGAIEGVRQFIVLHPLQALPSSSTDTASTVNHCSRSCDHC